MGLGKHGRNRTNVWDCAEVNSFGKGRDGDLVDRPTVKSNALVVVAIKDVTHSGDVALDASVGSGATLLAAEKSGRKARLIELDPLYADVAIRRWQGMTGKTGLCSGSGETFAAPARHKRRPRNRQRRPKSDQYDEYEVGYGKPTKHAQFKQGQSGNPRERPKGAKSQIASLSREMGSKVTIREGGGKLNCLKLMWRPSVYLPRFLVEIWPR